LNPPTASVQVEDVSEHGLELLRVHTGEGHTVIVAELNHRVALVIRGDQRRRLCQGLRTGEVIELDRIQPGIELADGIRDALRVLESVIATLDR
jgi:hypothetical protein